MKLVKLSDKNFVLIVIGQIISLFGNGILRFALPLYLLNITGSSAIFGIVSAVSFLPLVLLMPIGGIIADRANKRNIMLILDFSTGVLMIFFYLFMEKVTLIPLIIATLMILYSIGGLYQPTVQASVPILLDEKILVKGNGIVSSIGAIDDLISPVVGGMLFAAYGVTPIIVMSIICFFASAILEIFINIPHGKVALNTSTLNIVKEDTKVSINFIFKEKPILKKLMFVTCLLNIFISAFVIIALPVLITKRLMLSEEMYGFSQGILAFGGLFGGIMSSVFGNKLKIKKLYTYLLLSTIGLVPILIAMFFKDNPLTSYTLILIGSFLIMCAATIASVIIITYIQSKTPENMVGKVIAFVMTISMFTLPFGQAFYGLAFEYLIGYESFVMIGSIIISLIISNYAKNIFIENF